MNKVVKYLLLASFIGTAAESCLVPMWAILTKHVNGDIMDAGVGYAIFAIATGIFVFILGRWKAYQQNLHLALVWAFLIAGIGDFSFIFCTDVTQLFIVNCVIGLSCAILNTSWDCIFTNEMDRDTNSAEYWSKWNSGISFFQGIGALMAGVILYYFDWITLFIIMGLIDGIAIYFSYLVYKLIKNGKK
jgi:hypothetical protein